MKQIEAIIFDFDGVILDSANIKTEAFLDLFKEYPQHQKAIKEYHIQHQGITRYKKFEWIYNELLDLEYNEQVKEKLGAAFSNLVFDKIIVTDPIPGAIDFLKTIQKKGVPAFIASGTPDEELIRTLKERELTQYFSSVYGSNISKKEAIDTVSKHENVRKQDILFVGDAITDWKAAKSRQLPFIAVYSDEMDGFWEERDIDVVRNLMEIDKKFDINSTS